MSRQSKLQSWYTKRKIEFSNLRGKNPAKHLKLIAVSGSRGKTITAHLIHHILLNSSLRVGLISSEGVWASEQKLTPSFSVNKSNHKEIIKILEEMTKQEMQYVVIETHADLVTADAFHKLQFDSALITNIAGGELALGHKNVEDYAEQIFKPIRQIIPEGLFVINADDDSVDWIVSKSGEIPHNIFAAWTSKKEALNLVSRLDGMTFQYQGSLFSTQLFGEVMLENLLQAIRLSMKYVGMDQIDGAVSKFTPLLGRFELFHNDTINAIIDKEFTPTVLQKTLSELKQLLPASSKLLAITGLPAKYDRNSAAIAKEIEPFVDAICIAALDPGNQDVYDINSKIIQQTEGSQVTVVDRIAEHHEFATLDKVNLLNKIQRVTANGDVPLIAFDESSPLGRSDAMELMLRLAKPNDYLILLGKGNAQVMDFASLNYEWNDRYVLEEIIADLGKEKTSD